LIANPLPRQADRDQPLKASNTASDDRAARDTGTEAKVAQKHTEALSAMPFRARVRVGDGVRIERDEIRYPSRGTWPQFNERTGTVVEINTDRLHPHLTEFVSFGKVSPRSDGRARFSYDGASVAWFKAYELVLASAVERLQEVTGG
jgi:hypothetical protein